MKFVLLHNTDSAADFHRVTNPFMCLPSQNGQKFIFRNYSDGLKVGDLKDADIVVINRAASVDLNHLLYLKSQFRFKIWVDVDDIWELPAHHYLYHQWVKTDTKEKIIEFMKAANVVTVTNKRLLLRALEFNSKVVVVPNGLPITAGFQNYKPDKTESTKIRISYIGGESHEHDLATITKYFDYCGRSSQLQTKTEFTLAGYSPGNNIASPWHRMRKIMATAPGFRTVSPMPLDTYIKLYNDTDIVLAPLEDNAFNHFKSNLKIIEAGAMKTPILVSKQFPYLEDIEAEGKGVFFCENHRDFLKATLELTMNPHKISELGEQLYEYVKSKYDIPIVNKIREQIIDNLMK